MKSFMKANKDWILIILGLILTIFSILNLFNFDPFSALTLFKENPVVEQESFAPLIIPLANSVPAQGAVEPVSQA